MDLTTDTATAGATIDAAGAALTGAGRAGPDAAVAACPGGTVATLMKHVALIHAWVVATVRLGGSEPVAFPKAPAGMSGGELADWADEQRAGLLTALIETDPERPTWFFGEVRPARTWRRRQTHETTVHAWDATAALGDPWPIPSDIAADGIDELLAWLLPRRWSEHPPEWGARTDASTSIGPTVRASGCSPSGPPRRSTTATPRAIWPSGDPAPQLLLWAANRPATVELFGDTELAAGWAAHVAV